MMDDDTVVHRLSLSQGYLPSPNPQPQRKALYGTYTGSPCTRISPPRCSTLYVNCVTVGISFSVAPQHGPRLNSVPSSLLNSTTKSNCDADIAVARTTRRTSRQRSCNSQADRSEEHTSELQSRENLVCRLLLEK